MVEQGDGGREGISERGGKGLRERVEGREMVGKTGGGCWTESAFSLQFCCECRGEECARRAPKSARSMHLSRTCAQCCICAMCFGIYIFVCICLSDLIPRIVTLRAYVTYM